MVEAFAVASGKGGTGKTTATLAVGMALAADHDVTVVDADTGMANLLFHADLEDAAVTLHDLLISDRDVRVADAVYERFGLRVVPCGTDLSGFEAANPERLRAVIAELAADTDVLLLDSPATLESRSAVLPIVLADRMLLITQPTVPALSDGLKVQEYATSYGTDVAGVIFNKVHDSDRVDRVTGMASEYLAGPILGTVPDDESARAARRAGEPLLSHAPESSAASAFRAAVADLTVRPGAPEGVADRFRNAVVPEDP
ncbi:MAG: AAA family ATPase [Halodesulfurarchaeum sp.]